MAGSARGVWVVCDDFGEGVVDDLLEGLGATVPFVLPSGTVAAKGSYLALISKSPDTIDYVAVASAGRRVSELERKVVFGPVVKLAKPLRVADLLSKLEPKFSRHIQPPLRRASSPPPASWDALLEAIVNSEGTTPETMADLKNVLRSRERGLALRLPDVISQERDAVAVALETFRGFQFRQRSLIGTPVSADAPFIESLKKSGANVLEDRMIEHDLESFPGAEPMLRYRVGAVKYSTETGDLTIVNANRTGIEKTLGVDLVYYHHTFKCFTMVQYKRMTGQHTPVYRPNSDGSYQAEVSRMKAFLASGKHAQSSALDEYRIGTNPFFFKLCSGDEDGHWSRMLPGMYIPLDLWERLLLSDAALGPNGGVAVGYDNTHRRLNNSDFTRLVRGGWVGSYGSDSERISQIIEEELSANKSVIAAIHTERSTSEEYLRDRRGRFSSEEDLDAL